MCKNYNFFTNFSIKKLRVGHDFILKFSLQCNLMIINFWFFDSDPRQTLWSSPYVIRLKLAMLMMLHWMLSWSCHRWSMKHMLFSVPWWHYGHHWPSSISRLLDKSIFQLFCSTLHSNFDLVRLCVIQPWKNGGKIELSTK